MQHQCSTKWYGTSGNGCLCKSKSWLLQGKLKNKTKQQQQNKIIWPLHHAATYSYLYCKRWESWIKSVSFLSHEMVLMVSKAAIVSLLPFHMHPAEFNCGKVITEILLLCDTFAHLLHALNQCLTHANYSLCRLERRSRIPHYLTAKFLMQKDMHQPTDT